MNCENFGKETEELCGDGFCRDCHVSLSFEDCVSGRWVAQMNIQNGWPVSRLKKLYPRAELSNFACGLEEKP